MRHRVILAVAALGIAYLYLVGLTYAIGFAAAQPTPRWWIATSPTWRSGTLSWLMLSHAAAIVLVSLPVAWVVYRLYGRFSILVSLGVALAIWTTIEAPLLRDAARSPGLFVKGMFLADTLQLVSVLPILVWLLRRLPSNNRSRGP